MISRSRRSSPFLSNKRRHLFFQRGSFHKTWRRHPKDPEDASARSSLWDLRALIQLRPSRPEGARPPEILCPQYSLQNGKCPRPRCSRSNAKFGAPETRKKTEFFLHERGRRL